MPGFDIFRRAKSRLENLANRVGSRIRPPRETEIGGGPGAAPLPRELEGALVGLGAATIHRSIVRPPAGLTLPFGTAARREIDVPGAGADSLAVSHDSTRVVQWHLPHLPPAATSKFRVWVRRTVREGREVVVKSLPPLSAGLPDQALLDFVRAIEATTKQPGIKPFPLEPPQILDQQPAAVSAGGPAVLLVHGFFDRLFGFIFLPMFAGGPLLRFLHERYPGRVFGYDHFTLSVDPIDNAHELLALLPDGLELDIVCHSRGGLVTRALLQHPDIRDVVTGRNITIRKAVFIGAANLGTELARPGELSKLLTIFSTLMINHPQRELVPEETREAMLRLLVAAARGALAPALEAIPGVQALAPDSDCIRALSGLPVAPEVACSFVRSDFGGGRAFPGIELARIANTVFGGGRNDLVVPFDGAASLGAAKGASAGTCNLLPADGCNHLEFMFHEQVQRFIRDRLLE